MRSSGSPTAVSQFSLPPAPPQAIAAAADVFEEAVAQLQAAKTSLREAKAGEHDWRSSADPAEAVRLRDASNARIDAEETRVHALDRALDAAGDKLARAVGEHRGEWIASLAPTAQRAAEDYAAALDAAAEALRLMAGARGAVGWLEEFDVGLAIVGQIAQFPGSRVEIANERLIPLVERFDAAMALRLARKAIDPPAPQVRRTHRVAAVTR